MAETTGMMTMLVLSPLFQALRGKLELSYHDPEEKYSHPEFHIISAALTDTQITTFSIDNICLLANASLNLTLCQFLFKDKSHNKHFVIDLYV